MRMKKIFVVFLIASAIAMTVIFRQPVDNGEFAKNASRIAGHVVSKEELPAERGKEYWATYSYSDAKGTQHTTRARVEDAEIWKRLREGQVEMVYYDKNDPSKSYLGVILDKKLGKK